MVLNPRYPITIVLKDHGTDFSLKPYLQHIEYVETGNEEISHAKIILTSKFGKFIKPVTQAGVAIPKIEFFDRIYVKFTDPNGDITDDVLEVMAKFPGEEVGMGDTIELFCEHQGWHFFRGHNLKQYQRESGFDVIADQGNVYNDDSVRPIKAPIMELHDVEYNSVTELGNAASEATAIDFDFGNSLFFFGDAVTVVSDRLGSSVDNLGELEFFDWRTVSKYDHDTNSDLDTIQMQFRVSGDVASKVIIDKADAVDKILDLTSEQEPEKANSIYSWGDINSGSMPPGFSIYFGEKEAFFSAKDWADARNYKIGMRVQFDGAFYKAIQDHLSSGPTDPANGIGTFWNLDTFNPSVDYSLFTKNKPQYWINSGAGYVDAGFSPATNRAAMHDQNLVIRDSIHRRSWVDLRVTALADVPSSMYLLTGGSEMYRTFRILLDSTLGSLGTPFNQNDDHDRFGKEYVDSIVQHNGSTFTGAEEYKNWDVFLAVKDDLEIIVMREGNSYVYNASNDLSYRNFNNGSRNGTWSAGAYVNLDPLFGTASAGFFQGGAIADCLHPYNIVGANNPDVGNAQGIEGGIPGVNSAIRIKYEFADGARSQGVWLNLAFPTPRDGHATAGFTATIVGEVYANPTLDLNNMHLSSLGKRGINQGVDDNGRGALDYGKINAIRTYMKLITTEIAGLVNQLGGEFKFRFAFFDSADNVFIKDVTLSHKNNFGEITAKLPFEVYRGRHGLAFTPSEELEILDILQTRNIVRISIASSASYDENGRYLGFLSGFSPLFGSTELQLDAFHFVTPLSATTQKQTIQANKPDINLERETLDRPQISNYIQLLHDAQSELEITKFQRVSYKIRRPLRCNIKFGQEFTLKHPILIDDSDFGNNDEIDLVCKKNIYSYVKGKGRGGYTCTTYGSKRIRI